MKRLNLFFLLIAACFSALAQQPGKDPQTTEVWEPIPPKVTPGTGTAAPSDAIVLFDGKSTTAWESDKGGAVEWKIEDGAMTVAPGKGGIRTKQSFGDCQLHIEWRSPSVVKGEGQGRGNSGIFLMGVYELQVLDSYESRTYSNGQASSIYKQHIPLVNATKGPGEWQVYDVVFTAPRFSENGRVITPAYFTVFHNGILVQNHVALLGPTEYIGLPSYKAHGKAPLGLQDHGDLVSFRNIWIRPL